MGRSAESAARQREGVRQFKFTEATDARLQAHADANNQSASEVIREAMQVWTDDIVPPKRIRRTRRRSAWIDGELYVRFQRKAKAAELQQIEALEMALDEIL